jgi:hypothetical protein
MKRVFKRELKGNAWNEIHIIDDETNELIQYMQDKRLGFTFSRYTNLIFKMGYISTNDCIKSLKDRGILGIEVNYNEQMESERIGQINLETEQKRIKSNPIEYKQRIAALGM